MLKGGLKMYKEFRIETKTELCGKCMRPSIRNRVWHENMEGSTLRCPEHGNQDIIVYIRSHIEENIIP